MSNVFKDVGFEDAEMRLNDALDKAKSRIRVIEKLGKAAQKNLNERGGSEKQISDETGLSKSHVRRLLTGEFQKFTLSQLVDIALQLDMDIEIRVKNPKSEKPVAK